MIFKAREILSAGHRVSFMSGVFIAECTDITLKIVIQREPGCTLVIQHLVGCELLVVFKIFVLYLVVCTVTIFVLHLIVCTVTIFVLHLLRRGSTAGGGRRAHVEREIQRLVGAEFLYL